MHLRTVERLLGGGHGDGHERVHEVEDLGLDLRVRLNQDCETCRVVVTSSEDGAHLRRRDIVHPSPLQILDDTMLALPATLRGGRCISGPV